MTAMTTDTTLLAAQGIKMNRFSFGSSNGNGTPLQTSTAISNGDEYDSDGSNFAPM